MPVVSYLFVYLPEKLLTPNNISEGLKGPHRQFLKEALSVKYYKNKNASLILAPITIKSFPGGKKFLRLLIVTNIKEDDYSDGCNFFLRHCENGSSNIKYIGFDQSYSSVAHADSFRINITIAALHILTTRIFDVSNALHNTNVPIHERVCVSLSPYYLDWFERSYPNVHINQDEGPFCIQFMNRIQGTKPVGQQWN